MMKTKFADNFSRNNVVQLIFRKSGPKFNPTTVHFRLKSIKNYAKIIGSNADTDISK